MLAAGLILGYVFAQTRIPIYRSAAMVEVEKVHRSRPLVTDLFTFSASLEAFYKTQIELLKSQNVVNNFLT